MRIGIFIENNSPTDGGAFTLLETLKKDIVSYNYKHEIFFFFEDKIASKRFMENKITYINIFYKKTIIFRIRRKILFLLGLYHERPSLDDVLHKEQIDLLWILGPNKLDITIPYVFTVWDLGHRMLPCFPEVYKEQEWDERENIYTTMLYRATYIITGNETGKNEILANYAINQEKIHIIPFPIPNFCFEKIETPEILNNIKSPFVFYPSQFWPHKNHIALIEAIAWLRDLKNIIINCYFVGSDKGNLQYINAVINKQHLENQIFILGFVEKAVLRYLYKNALAMTYVSLLGPNNLPPLEAAALGCPLIISNIPGHIEQMEGQGFFVDVKNPIEIGEAILSIYHNPAMRQNLISSEFIFIEKYKTYSYFKEMQKIIDIYALFCKTWKNV
jgi:glycosyltransferase involved in cell wall biosynthesis